MKKDGVYSDFVDYMDAKIEYDKSQNLGYDEVDGMSDFSLKTEPVPSEKLQIFSDKWLI